MSELAVQLLDEKIDQLKTRLKNLQLLRNAAEKDAEIVSELHEILIRDQQFTTEPDPADSAALGVTAYHRVVAWMLHDPDAPQTVSQICSGTKMDKGSVQRALYMAKHSDDFVSELVPGHTRNVQWRLSAKAVQKFRALGVQLDDGPANEVPRPKRGSRRHLKPKRGRR